ncbi:unnamed protein product, partial [Rotaria magnacalcarata]
DAQSNIYVSDYTNHRVSLWAAGNTTAGKVVAGTSNGVAGSGINQLNGPWGIFVTSNGTLYIVDQNNHRVQRWLRNATSGSTVAGQSGVAGAFSYQLRSPTSITVDQYGYMYVLDSGNKRIQRWWPGSTYGITVVSSTSMLNPRGLNFDTSGNLFVADYSNHRILKFTVTCRE